MSETYDLVIIGGGSAGLTAAGLAAQLGVRVALVERHRLGGDCTWYGCVPSKTLLKAAKVAHQMRTAHRHGLSTVEPAVDLKAVMAHVQSVIADVYREESPEVLRADGIDVYLDAGRFLDSRTLAAGQTSLTARHFLIATGARPFIPPIAGLEDVEFLTYESVWNMETLPRHLLVVGAGPIGCEMAQAFRRLGSQVTLVASRDRVLPRDDPAASCVLGQVLTKEGVDLRYDVRAQRVWQDRDGIHLVAGDVVSDLVGDALLVAVGRQPNVDGLGLEKAGVAYSVKGIQVNENLRTSQRNIYAAGDCIGPHKFTHYAGWQAVVAVRNTLLPGLSRGISDRVPWTTFTDPEVAHVGLTEAQARERWGDEVLATEWPMDKVDRARAEGDTTGFVKLVHRKDGTLLGVTIVAGRAGEMIHEWIVALEHGLKISDLANIIHVYPTYSTASMQAAADIRMGQLMSGPAGWIARRLAHLLK